jgi:hypothetical protein
LTGCRSYYEPFIVVIHMLILALYGTPHWP